MEQELIIAGVSRMAGKSKNSGNDYDFCKVSVLQPIQTNKVVQQAYGFEATDFNCEADVLSQLRTASFPATVRAQMIIGRDTKVSISSIQLLNEKPSK